MSACTRIYPIGGKALVFTSGQYQYGKDIDGFWKVNHPVGGVVVVPNAQALETPSGDLKISGQLTHTVGTKGSFVSGTWTDQ